MVVALPHIRDVSQWQPTVNWAAEAKTVAGVWVKCTQGASETDPYAVSHIKGAIKAGIKRTGGYHYCVPGSGSPESQVDRFLALAPLAAGRLKPVLDCEDNTLRLNAGQLAAWYLGAVIRCHTRLGYYPVIYGNPSYLGTFATVHAEVFGLCPLWVADYGVTVPKIPAPWSHWAAWQHTDSWHDPAFPSLVDDSFAADLPLLTVPAKKATQVAKAIYSGVF